MIQHVLALWIAAQAGAPQLSACSQSVVGAGSGAATELCLAEESVKQADATAPNDRTRLLKAAVEHYRRATRLTTAPEVKVRALEGLERVYDAKHLNELDDLEQVIREIIILQPTELGPVFRLATVQEGRGFVDAAEETLLDARRQHPAELDCYRMLAQFYARRATALHQLADWRNAIQARQGPPERDENGVYRIGGPLDPPKRAGVAEYSPEARAAGLEGVVQVEIVISPNGDVTDAKVVRSIPLLDEEAIRAVRQWKFDPTIVNGQAVPVRMTVSVNFTLRR